MAYSIRDKDGYAFYDGPYWAGGKKLEFETEEAAQSYLEYGNWHLDGAIVVPSTTYTCACMGACDC